MKVRLRVYATDEVRRIKAKNRRELLESLGRCINSPIDPATSTRARVEHGPVVPGSKKCQRCLDVHSSRKVAA